MKKETRRRERAAVAGDEQVRESGPDGRSLRALVDAYRIRQDEFPMLEVIFERAKRSLSTSLRSILHQPLELLVDDIASDRFDDVVNRVPLPAIFGVFQIPEWGGSGLIVADASLVHALVDAALGGDWQSARDAAGSRAFTAIEIGLAAKFMQVLASDLAAAFAPLAAITARLERTETNPRFAGVAAPTDPVSLGSLRIGIDGSEGQVSVLLPHALLDPIRGDLLHRFSGSCSGRDRNWADTMEAQLRRSELPLQLTVAAEPFSLGRLQALAIGDVVRLSLAPTDPVAVTCNGKLIAMAELGKRDGRSVARLVSEVGHR